MEKSSGSSSRMLVAAVAVGVTVLCTAVLTLFVARQFYADRLCQGYETAVMRPRLHFGKTAQFEETYRLHIHEKGVTVMKTTDSERCYVMPLNEGGEERKLALVHDPLGEELLEELAGESGVRFCGEDPAYLLKDIQHIERTRAKRQAAERASGLNLEYDERNPRCMDLILDCAADGAVGQVQQCYTWMNGVILMKQECVSATQFKIYMSKPPGRILKIAQQQWKECLARRSEGLRC